MAITKNSAKFRKDGQTVNYTIAANGTALKEGDFVVIGGIVAIAQWPIAAGTTGVVKVLDRGQVIEVTTDDKLGSTDAGTAIYLDGSKLVTKSATRTEGSSTVNNTLLGYAREAIGANDLTFEVICA